MRPPPLDSRENDWFGAEICRWGMLEPTGTPGTQEKSAQCLTASHFDPEPMRGSLAGMPARIFGGQRITGGRSCLTIRATPLPHATNSAICARATLPASTSNSLKTTNLRRASSAGLPAVHASGQNLTLGARPLRRLRVHSWSASRAMSTSNEARWIGREQCF